MVLPTGPGSCTVVYDYYLDTAEIGRLGDQVLYTVIHTATCTLCAGGGRGGPESGGQ